jgi:cytoskeletal protein CcmA (bactofilin family)
MAIFKNENDPYANPSPSPQRSVPTGSTGGQATQVAAGSRIQGEISGSTELMIDGEVEGKLKIGNNVVVGAKGVVKGEIEARTVRVGGKVVGNVKGQERVEILSSGNVEGDVAAPRVIIADGAFFKGNVEMTGQDFSGGGSVGKASVPKGEKP